MNARRWVLAGSTLICAVGLLAAGVWMGGVPRALSASQSAPPAAADQESAPPAAVADPLIFSYAAKFVCTEPLQAGTQFYGLAAPVVQQKTDVLVHNPNDFTVNFYKKAVRARLGEAPPVTPGNWQKVDLAADQATRLDCDQIAKLLTGNPDATFLGTYGIGVTVEGFVVLGVGPQTVPGRGNVASAYLDVTGEYVRSSEVLKKDISYQPWWVWWWWGLPWRLGYAYERIVPVNTAGNIDCRSALYEALAQEAQGNLAGQQLSETLAALQHGFEIDPTTVNSLSNDTLPALVVLIGRCDKIVSPQSGINADISYVLVSNKSPSDPNPITGVAVYPVSVVYPWVPGHWYDLPVVMPQNTSSDLDQFINQWHTLKWITANNEIATNIAPSMVYYFPYWCGWGHWWWWWNAGDCTDIGVGEGESLDVVQVNPVRVFMSAWPPTAQ